MRYLITFVALAFLGLAAAALAENESKTKIAITVVSDESGDKTRVELDGDELGFNLDDMQVGENRSVVDKNGQPVLITREVDGYKLEINGKTVRIPEIYTGMHGGDPDIDAQVMKNVRIESIDGSDNIMILSGKPIDDATRQAIKSLLESAGHGSEVHFIDHEAGERGHVKFRNVHKRVEVIE